MSINPNHRPDSPGFIHKLKPHLTVLKLIFHNLSNLQFDMNDQVTLLFVQSCTANSRKQQRCDSPWEVSEVTWPAYAALLIQMIQRMHSNNTLDCLWSLSLLATQCLNEFVCILYWILMRNNHAYEFVISDHILTFLELSHTHYRTDLNCHFQYNGPSA